MQISPSPLRSLLDRLFLLRHSPAAAGVLLFAAAVLAIIVANTGLAGAYRAGLDTVIGLHIGGFAIEDPAGKWINDGLMAIFFLLVGLEIKREILDGELSSFANSMMPAIAAVGGMVGPALIFAALNHHDATLMRGWAIPVATDIAFSLGVLALLGKRVPLSLKVFLTAVAVIDDLLAIVIIALFYTAELKFGYLLACAGLLALMLAFNFRLRVRAAWPYLVVGALLWYYMHKSGVHATLAGVATAFCIPHLGRQAGAASPLNRLEHALHAPVAFGILPLFAFANSGVSFAGLSIGALFTESLSAGILFGLLFGKPLGICLALFIAVKLGVGPLPRATNWPMMLALSLLCGIGFTVSLFIGALGFGGLDPALLNQVKAGVLAGSVCAGVLGYLVLRGVLRGRAADAAAS
ncbi:MAG: Na+/H+ antiporter NhaA [Betaproteobacteria bacterium AqS2]|uniref:Na(+)/H(+) antiporter NhaA n=1 Tax=Candidatus Amphirhobacter heronislandensis TaxID=1732024 RepID=A0A930XXB8_9GAMM|nr:Na+/H+ antiporter NhaA [Betaproteobacteria bacterium AqS2]